MKNLKFSLMLFLLFMGFMLTANSYADEITLAEVKASPSVLSAGAFNQNVYLQGINTQLFSGSSKKEPEIEVSRNLTVNFFQIMSPKLALLNLNVGSAAFGSLQVNLKFYDIEATKVVKTCVFYIDVLGPKVEDEYTTELTTIPDIFVDIATAQVAGSIEITGPLKGNVVITPPTGTKFFSGIEPTVTCLTMNASVSSVEVSQAGDSLTFFVENQGAEVVKIFITNLFLDSSEFTRNSGVRGQLNVEVKSGSISNTLIIPIANTAGYTSNLDENVEKDTSSTSNSSQSKNSDNYSSSSSNSNNSSSSNKNSNTNAKESNNKKSNNPTYYSSSRKSYSDYRDEGRQNYSSSYSGERPSMQYNRRGSTRNKMKPQTQPGKKGGEDDDGAEIEKMSWPKFAKVNPADKSKNKIANVVFCNSKFVPLKAIPLEVSKDGFVVKFSLEIELINADDREVETFTVNVSLPGIDPIKMTLVKVKNNIYRSQETIKAVLPFAQFN